MHLAWFLKMAVRIKPCIGAPDVLLLRLSGRRLACLGDRLAAVPVHSSPRIRRQPQAQAAGAARYAIRFGIPCRPRGFGVHPAIGLICPEYLYNDSRFL